MLNLNRLLVLTLLLLVAKATHAQTNAPAAANTIEAARAAAQADLDRLAIERRAETSKSEGFDPCVLQLIDLQRKYAQWFKDRYQEYLQIEKQIDAALGSLADKIALLKKESIKTLPVPPQTEASVEVSFPTVVAYLKNYNGRIKTCSKDKLDLLKKMQESPENNPLHVAHSQVVEAMKSMTNNLNASLKETGSRFSVGFAEAACGYDLVLTVELEITAGVRKEFRVSLLEDSAKPGLNKDQKWSMFYGEGERIGDYSASGNVRYLEMYHESVSHECALENWAQVSPGELQSTLVPYVSFKQVNAEINAAIKRGPIDNASGVTRQAQIQKRLKFELRPDSKNCTTTPSSYGVETFAPYLDGKQVGIGCVYGAHVVEFGGDTFIFGIGADHRIYMRSASAPAQSHWTPLDTLTNVASIVDSGVHHNRPYIVVLTRDAQVYAADASGAKISGASHLIPSPKLGNTSPSRITLDLPGQCSSGGGTGSLKLDGKALPTSGCVTQFLALPFYNDFFIFGIGGAPHEIFYRTLYTQWTKMDSGTGVAKLTGVAITAGRKPQITYTNNQAQINSREVH